MIETKSGHDRAKTGDLAAAHVLVWGLVRGAGSTAAEPDLVDFGRCLGAQES